jgi:Fur family transcriptional regulator, ferric uptake regulator
MINKSEKLLKANGLKVTKGRMAVLNILKRSVNPLDVGDIIRFCRNEIIRIDPVTVYRILNTFLKHNIIQKTEFNEGKFRYEIKNTTHHHHAVCTKCGRIKDIRNCGTKKMEQTLINKMSFLVHSHRLEFFGLCAKCRN